MASEMDKQIEKENRKKKRRQKIEISRCWYIEIGEKMMRQISDI